jgi:hypothetical protein
MRLVGFRLCGGGSIPLMGVKIGGTTLKIRLGIQWNVSGKWDSLCAWRRTTISARPWAPSCHRLERQIIIVLGVHIWQGAGRQRQIGDGEKVQDIVTIHEHDLAALGRVKPVAKPVACGFGNLTT